MSDDRAAREAKAKEWEEELERLTGGASPKKSSGEAPLQPQEPESPRDFIHRRMHELDEREKP
jgi:hypothetical protein